MAVIQMTDEEKALLDLAYTDGARILEGKLFDYQERALAELRSCREFLAKRYPKENFKVISFQPSSRKGSVELQFVQPEKETAEYILKYENGQYSDNFYDVPFEREYDEIVEGLLEKADVHARVYTYFPFLISDEIHSGRELMDRRPHLGRHTALFFPADELSDDKDAVKLLERIRTVFRENGIYTSGILFFIKDAERLKAGSVLELDAYCRNRKNAALIKNVTFRSFQVDK